MKRPYRERIYPEYTSNQMPQSIQYSLADYEKVSQPMLHRLHSWMPEDKTARCLDIGCGAGEWLFALKQSGFKNVTGIDISPQQIGLSKRVCDDVHVADVLQYLQNHPGHFDFITGFDIIEHFGKEEIFPLVDALYSALRSGGRLVLQTPNAESPWGLKIRYGDFTHELAFDSLSLQSVLSISGFKIFEAKECGPYIHGIASFARWLVWRLIATSLSAWNLAETGNIGSGIYTRVFVVKVDRIL